MTQNGSSVLLLDEGVAKLAQFLDFIGAGVTVSVAGGKASISIPGGAALQKTEQTFGSDPAYYGTWTIVDAGVLATSHILAGLSAEAPAALRDGVAADGDEAEMEPMALWAENIAAGSFLLVAVPVDGPVDGPYVFTYLIG